VITGGQVQAGTVSGTLMTVPAGPCMAVVSNLGPGTVFIGPGTSVTSTNGVPVPPAVPIPVVGYQPNSAQVFSVICNAGGTASVGWLISRPSAGTGL